ncbi:MAG TPA: thioredoxin domain-containing protein [Dehalococcoidia bacterium]|nr:thioredoxin domain-containing protein [Dehalococcoidia bacterium]
MPNRLANETSPYLLQHKDNPVDWYPWGDEALSKAQKEDRPILLSIGYSACHWCHVMERESFENHDIAALMNQHFVNIKVDREERPDLDGIYMQAVQAMTGRGGWPMTVFLMPDGTPFYGGTYFPPEDRHGLPGFPKLLTAVAEAYRDDRESLVRQGQNLIDRIGAADGVTGDPTQILGDDILHTAVAQLRTRFDYQHGGFGSAPKFPNPMDLELLLRYHHRFADKGALDMALTTLRAMANGGIYDQVGGGFHRYSTDAVWLVPHFEKMLYDNAQLAAVYLDAYLVTKDPFYERICRETLDYVLREMTHESGAFFSTQDADSEGEEGKFFVWTPAELDAVLGGDSEAVKRYYGISEAGNFEGKNILHVADEAEPPAALQTAPHKLYEAREQRVHPGRDEKVLTSWNGMMLRAFALAGRSLDDDRYLAAATANADFMLGAMRPEGRLLRTWKAGTARLLGYLEDYACLVDGLIATYEATFEPRYLSRARDLASQMIELFWDADRAIFYDTGKDHEVLVTRPRDVFDNATPAGNSVAIDALLRLSALTGDEAFERVATAALRGMQPFLRQMPSGFGRALSALDFYLATRRELVIVWDDGRAEADALLRTAFDEFRPNVVVAGGKAGPELESLSPLLEARSTIDGRPTAYVCQNYACQQPVTDAKALAAQLA